MSGTDSTFTRPQSRFRLNQLINSRETTLNTSIKIHHVNVLLALFRCRFFCVLLLVFIGRGLT